MLFYIFSSPIAYSPGKMSNKVEVIAIELVFALLTSKRSLFQHFKSLPKSASAN